MKTQEEIEGLKNAWLNDPCWDIELSEGFEEHKEELLKFRMKTEQRWKDQENKDLMQKAENLGIPGNTDLVKYINYMEQRIKNLEESMMAIGEYIS